MTTNKIIVSKNQLQLFDGEVIVENDNNPTELNEVVQFVNRINSFFKNEIDILKPNFDIQEDGILTEDGRYESIVQENPIREYLISKNDRAIKYNIQFEYKSNKKNRSTEDIVIVDLSTGEKHLSNIKSKQYTNATNIGKASILGYVLTGKDGTYSNKKITFLIREMENNLDLFGNNLYFYITYLKDLNRFVCHELTHIAQEDILVNPSNFLQSKFQKRCVKRNKRERLNFLINLWKSFRDKVLDGFDGLDE